MKNEKPAGRTRVKKVDRDRLATVAAAAAHDLNNELTIALNALIELRYKLVRNGQADKIAAQIQTAATHAAFLNSAFLTYIIAQGAQRTATSFEALAVVDREAA